MMKNRIYLFAALVFTTMLASCSPQLFYMPVDMRYKSQSGLDLGGKSFSVVYLDNGFKADSCLNHGLAEGFAIALEKEYFGGESRIDIYKMKEQEGVDYSNKDTLVNLVLDSQRDVVFLLGTPNFTSMSVSTPERGLVHSADSALKATAYMGIEQDIYVYDSMYKKDTVLSKKAKQTLVQPIYLPLHYTKEELLSVLAGSLEPEGIRAGAEMAKTYFPTWKTEEYGIIYYEKDDWLKAAQYAYDYHWQEAMKIWLDLVDVENSEKRSCAEYDLSLACYMLGDYKLALEWLDRSDKDCPIYLNSQLRKRILDRMQ